MVGFPLLLIPLAVYNIIVFLMPGVSFADTLFKIPMVSGEEWAVSLSDVLIALAIVLLLLEVIKGARPGAKYLTDHLLSFIVFGAAAAEFVMWPKFGNSTFFLLTLLAMADFFSGVALRVRRRVAVGDVAAVPAKARAKPTAEVPAAKPQFDAPAPPPPAPAAPTAVSPPALEPEPHVPSPASSQWADHPRPNPAPDPEAPLPQPHPDGTTPPDSSKN